MTTGPVPDTATVAYFDALTYAAERTDDHQLLALARTSARHLTTDQLATVIAALIAARRDLERALASTRN